MSLKAAPLFDDVAEAPKGGAAYWLHAADGVRIRAAVWDKGDRGTVLMFPGRTDCIEKYGPAAGEFQARGYAMIAVDWRGQGLADRLVEDPNSGHVADFSHYQDDVQAVLEAARALKPPEPYYLVAHSMGGCIGLRALNEGLPVRAACFSAPMWGLRIAPLLRPVVWLLAAASGHLGQGHRYAPGTSATTYVRMVGFAENLLTRDAAMFAFMQRQLDAHPELALGGPSLTWLHEALRENRLQRRMPAPKIPTVTALGTLERIVEPRDVQVRMADWPGGRLDLYDGAEHEIMMETPAHRKRFYDAAAALFAAHPG